jgi:hypothetical protein
VKTVMGLLESFFGRVVVDHFGMNSTCSQITGKVNMNSSNGYHWEALNLPVLSL